MRVVVQYEIPIRATKLTKTGQFPNPEPINPWVNNSVKIIAVEIEARRWTSPGDSPLIYFKNSGNSLINKRPTTIKKRTGAISRVSLTCASWKSPPDTMLSLEFSSQKTRPPITNNAMSML